MNAATTADHRKEYRFLADANIEVFNTDNEKSYAVCCNISTSGIMIISNHAFKPADQLKLRILQAGKYIIARVTVLHCLQRAENYHIGCTADFSEAAAI